MTPNDILYYGVIGAYIIMLSYRVIRLHIMKKHNSVLYGFCDVRRDLMSFLRNADDSLESRTYEKAKETLVFLNGIIHYYHSKKKSMFRVRRVLTESVNANEKINAMLRTGNSDLDKINEKVHIQIIRAAFVFTPFLRSWLLFIIFKFITREIFRQTDGAVQEAFIIRNEGRKLGIA